MNFTWDCIRWTLLEPAVSELYLRLLSVHFTWACCQWTLLETAVSELYSRLHPMNFAWGCIQQTLLEAASNELYSGLLPVNFTWDCCQWTLLSLLSLHFAPYLRLHWMSFTSNSMHAISFWERTLPSFIFFQEKCHKFLTRFWRTFDALLTHFWRTFDALLTHFWRTFDALLKSASKVHQKAVKVHQKCITFESASKVHQKCIKSAPKVHQKCIKSASKVHQKCIKSASKVHQKCTKSASKVLQKCIKSAPKASEVHCIFDRVQAFFWKKLWTHVKKYSCGIESGVRVSLRLLGCIFSSQPKVYQDFIQTFSKLYEEKSTTRVYELPFKFSFEKDMSSVPMDNCFFKCKLIKFCSKQTWSNKIWFTFLAWKKW